METIIEGSLKKWGGGRDGKKCFMVIDVQRTSDGQVDTVTIWSDKGLPTDVGLGKKIKCLVGSRENTVNEIKRM
ncbi:MAG: hypothetical protein A2Y97_06590 [Nitrospirae bacterium RBG_13_39_12]|nr:MAG: hypothetical protein A2Y97_06590 [Nitrospirae bacterium RBG_13_39_12]